MGYRANVFPSARGGTPVVKSGTIYLQVTRLRVVLSATFRVMNILAGRALAGAADTRVNFK